MIVPSIMALYDSLFENVGKRYYQMKPQEDYNVTAELKVISTMQQFSFNQASFGIREINNFIDMLYDVQQGGLKFQDSHAYFILCRRRDWLQERRNGLLGFKKAEVAEDWTCAICLDSTSEKVVQFKACHTFHRRCIEQWAWTHSTCPVCRQ